MIRFSGAMSEPRFPDYPNVSAMRDRHGKLRWRFRKGSRQVYLSGEPHTDAFDASYRAAVAGLPQPAKQPPRRTAEIVRIATSAKPESFRAAWRIYTKSSPDWKALKDISRVKQSAIAEEFLSEKVSEESPLVWADVPVADLRRRHVKKILADMAGTPFAAKHRLTVIRKMIEVALDEEWIEADPTHKIKYRPERIKGWRSWTDQERDLFEARWIVGTTPRLVYELAFWLGNRRGDIATLRWDQRGTWRDPLGETHDVFRIAQQKGGKEMILPITSSLAEVLRATPVRGATIVTTEYGQPFSEKSLTGRMADWTRSAKMQKGCTLHGLRKTLGRTLAESDATTRQLMEVLGHDDIEHAELYSREASQARLAVQGMQKVASFEAARKKRR